MKRTQVQGAVAFGAVIAVAIAVATGVSGKDSSGSARAQAQAACAVVAEWETSSGSTLNINDMLYAIQQDADKAASGDRQWQFLADDASNLKNSLIMGSQVHMSGVVVEASPNFAFAAAQRQIETDCTHV